MAKNNIKAQAAPHALQMPSIAHQIPNDPLQTGFSTIRQGALTNELTKLRPVVGFNTVVDQITGAATVTQGALTVSFSGLDGLKGLKTSTYKLLDAITVSLTESGARNQTVCISLEDYMNKCGLKDRKEARKQAKADLEALFNASVSFREKPRKNRRGADQEAGFLDMRICESKGISRAGIISFGFGTSFFEMLKSLPVMPYPPQLWRINPQRNPNSYYLLRKISEHKNMNIGKPNEDIISVQTLLKAAVYIPSFDDVMSGNKNVTARIIEPFERDMDELQPTLSWEYCHRNGAPMTDQELEAMNYSLFSSLNVQIKWHEYPDQARRIEAKRGKSTS